MLFSVFEGIQEPFILSLACKSVVFVVQAFYRQKWVNLSLIAKECFLTDFGPETCPL